MCRRETGGTGILGGEECVLTELNQLLTGEGRVVDLGCRRSLSLGWVVEYAGGKLVGLGSLEQIVHSVTHGQLTFNWSSISRTQIERLQRNSAARACYLVKIVLPYYTYFTRVALATVSCRIVYKLLLFVFKSLNDSAPAYIDDMLKPYNPDNLNLIIESKSIRSFSHAAPRLWNQLPSYVKSLVSLIQYQKNLKTHHFNEAFT